MGATMEVKKRRAKRRIARRLQRLGTARIVCLATSLGMSIAAAGLLAVGIAYLFVGDFRLLGFLRPFVINAGFVALLMGVAVPAINRMIVREASREPGPDLSVPLMELITGLPLGSLGGPVGAELAAVLGMTDAEWWSANRREMAPKVKLAFVSFENPSKLNPLDSPWAAALVNALARCGRTEFLPRLERLESRSPRLDHPESLRTSLAACTASLRDRQRRDREAATLLRVAESGDDLLLRPAGESAGSSSPDHLLRPTSDSAQANLPALDTSAVDESSTSPEVQPLHVRT